MGEQSPAQTAAAAAPSALTAYPFPADLVAQIIARRGHLHCYDALAPARTALVVVDMQRGFVDEDCPTSLRGARAIVPTINRLAQAVRRAGGEVLWIVWALSPGKKHWPVFFEHVLGGEGSELFRETFTIGNPGQALWHELDFQPGEALIGKTNFSGFSGSGGALEQHLRENGRDTVLIAGTVTNVCCESTAREAAFANFRTVMVADANAGRSETDNAVAFATFIRAFGDVMSADEIIERLGRSSLTTAAGAC